MRTGASQSPHSPSAPRRSTPRPAATPSSPRCRTVSAGSSSSATTGSTPRRPARRTAAGSRCSTAPCKSRVRAAAPRRSSTTRCSSTPRYDQRESDVVRRAWLRTVTSCCVRGITADSSAPVSPSHGLIVHELEVGNLGAAVRARATGGPQLPSRGGTLVTVSGNGTRQSSEARVQPRAHAVMVRFRRR